MSGGLLLLLHELKRLIARDETIAMAATVEFVDGIALRHGLHGTPVGLILSSHLKRFSLYL